MILQEKKVLEIEKIHLWILIRDGFLFKSSTMIIDRALRLIVFGLKVGSLQQ